MTRKISLSLTILILSPLAASSQSLMYMSAGEAHQMVIRQE